MVNVGRFLAYMASYMGFNGKNILYSRANRRMFGGVRKCSWVKLFVKKSWFVMWCFKKQMNRLWGSENEGKSNSFSKTDRDKFPIWHFQFDRSYRQKSTWKNPTPKTASIVEVRLMKENALSMSDLDPDGTGTSSMAYTSEWILRCSKFVIYVW